uniref:SNTX MACPF/CDC-like domain-containing protein n=1 Tax=Panagrolaimus davidi TaxID=227884 RepID=A0A914QR43_9BILA
MDETIWKQSLGRSVSLGDCYDATTEKFTGLNIFIKEIPNEVIRKQDITNQSWNYDFSNSTTSKLSMLNLDGELKLSLLCGMLPNISGSAKFIENKTTNKEEVRCTFALFTNTIEQRIEINDMALCDIYDKRIDSFKGTHVVTRLKWGSNAVAELFIENDEKIGKTEIAGAIKANLGKMALSDATIQGNIKHESFDLSKVTKIRWSVNADVISNTKTPKNAEEALNIIYHLPEQIKENGNGRPLEFCLLPLKELKESLGYASSNNTLFYKIESTAVLKVEQQFTEIESSRLDLLTLRDFMTTNIEFVTPNELKTLQS